MKTLKQLATLLVNDDYLGHESFLEQTTPRLIVEYYSTDLIFDEKLEEITDQLGLRFNVVGLYLTIEGSREYLADLGHEIASADALLQKETADEEEILRLELENQIELDALDLMRYQDELRAELAWDLADQHVQNLGDDAPEDPRVGNMLVDYLAGIYFNTWVFDTLIWRNDLTLCG